VSNVHSTIGPLCFFDDVQTGVNYELVHVLCRVWEAEPGNAVAATFGGAECDIKDGRIGG